MNASLIEVVPAGEAASAHRENFLHNQIDEACARACKTIAPVWPLDRAIAVNPHWLRTSTPMRTVAARLGVLGGVAVFPQRDVIKSYWHEGRIQSAEVAQALHQVQEAREAQLTVDQCEQALHSNLIVGQLPLLIDLLDTDARRHTRLSWRDAVSHQVSQTCAAYFDEHQANWRPERTDGLYCFWRETLAHDHGIGLLMGLPQISAAINALPETPQAAEQWVMKRLGLSPDVWSDYLEAVLLTVNGWASWCAYLGWQADLAGRSDRHLRELLAIRLAWGVLLLECVDDVATSQAFTSLQQAWQDAPALIKTTATSMLIDEVWQVALEIGYQKNLAQRLFHASCTVSTRRDIQVQAAFCIDVRSEPLRRALEAVSPAIQTLGFAGFFGLPAAYTPLATQARRPQLPGLLSPSVDIADRIVAATSTSSSGALASQRVAERERQAWLANRDLWQSTGRWPGSAFSFVEAAGLGYVGKLCSWLMPARHGRSRDDLAGLSSRNRAISRPHLIGLTLDQQVGLAARVLHAMGLTGNLAPLVLLVGHGSQSANNAHAAALECGACCGQTGEVNARSLAFLLNDPNVRIGLQGKNVIIPDSTVFVAALHNTTTDEIEGFDLDLLVPQARARWDALLTTFSQACDQVRRERAVKLNMNPRTPHNALLRQFRERANDGAQTRPEWGLARNAAFLIAPRTRSQGVVLDGRTFLHDYDASTDNDGSILAMLMTAPMVVAHWINWQYHASTCDPDRLGSGNKLLHNVVGGYLGVFEGNGGDLRIGLSRQSLHDGTRWVHEPLRLTVVIDASRFSIDRVLGEHQMVKHLVDNHWLHLWRFAHSGFERYERGEWVASLEHGY